MLKKGVDRGDIIQVIQKQNGIIFSEPCIVYRESYAGRDIIGKNSKFEKGYTDERGYVPVERWILSNTSAENNIKKDNEGLTELIINNKKIFLKDALNIVGYEILGDYAKNWPLVKILDIGGEPKQTSFSDIPEVPPIPPHVHSGNIINGIAVKPGKLESYFFPPLDIPPYNKNIENVITRIGLKKKVTKEQFEKILKKFGKDDSMYQLLKEYKITPYSGWTIPSGTIHAPGPYITFEIQLPQDDFNLAAWRLGERIKDSELKKSYNNSVLRGLKNESDFIKQVLDWDLSKDTDFEKKYFKQIKILEQGDWGKHYQIFFNQFYGEGWEINPKSKFEIKENEKPIGAIVWSGRGKINNNFISYYKNNEFIITPDNKINLENNYHTKLILFSFEPIKNDANRS